MVEDVPRTNANWTAKVKKGLITKQELEYSRAVWIDPGKVTNPARSESC